MKATYVRAGVSTLAAFGLAFFANTAHADTIIAGYDFENLPTTTTTAAAPSLILADLGADSGTATLVAGGTAFANVSGDGTTPGYAYTTPGDDAPSTSTPSNDTLRLGVGGKTNPSNNGSSLLFSASTTGFSNVTSFTYDTYASSASAFQTQTFGYSTNGGTTFTTLTPIAVPAQGTVAKPVTGADAAGYSPETFNLSGIVGLAENPNAEFEIVFSGAPAYTGTAAPNDRVDNVIVNGIADISPAPEPSQVAGLTFFLLGVSALAFRARKRANTGA